MLAMFICPTYPLLRAFNGSNYKVSIPDVLNSTSLSSYLLAGRVCHPTGNTFPRSQLLLHIVSEMLSPKKSELILI